MHILEEFELHPLIKLNLFGIDLSINKAVLTMWAVVLVVFVSFMLARRLLARRKSLIPTGIHNFLEVFIQFIKEDIILETMGKDGLPWLPFIGTLFFFILGSNLFGLIPGFFTPTSNINVTATLAVIVAVAVQGVGVSKHGLWGYIKGLVPSGVPLPMAIMMFPIEIVGQIAKPFSLAVRLFANMTAGHLALIVFLSLIIYFKSYIIAPFPLLGNMAMILLEILFSFIQAFIFTVLSAMYIGTAIQSQH